MSVLSPQELDEIGAAIGLPHDTSTDININLHRAEIALAGMALHHYILALKAGNVPDVEGPDDAQKQELVAKYLMLRLAAVLDSAKGQTTH